MEVLPLTRRSRTSGAAVGTAATAAPIHHMKHCRADSTDDSVGSAGERIEVYLCRIKLRAPSGTEQLDRANPGAGVVA
ncbi:hypothetical protein GCM10011608_57270 [Micromonospora sonchi]|uniref:Uncharacterized protein n=1 Tax=Micromonospora sonchi TaxID=1763543 RepID=A0A917U7L7_9ACTN|nr:hypothetical protein GCM10011608_57270 [Micromonospora sonchi]